MIMNGNYLDEMILETIKKYEMELEREKPLEYQIRIQDKTVELSARSIYMDISMRLPKYFSVKSGDETVSGYLIKHRPEIIFSSGCGSVNFTFDRIEREYGQQIIKELIDLMRQRYPQNTIYDLGKGKLMNQEQEFYWFDYKSFAIDSDVYNLLFIFPYNDKTVVGTFKCAFRNYSDWKHYILKMISTIEYKSKGDSC
ncbi:MAG: hypothetical protein HDR12_06805 [Lachnospiraceae bacterium]|nr:hypothetical protein [Lachnospiraceae bacterium]